MIHPEKNINHHYVTSSCHAVFATRFEKSTEKIAHLIFYQPGCHYAGADMQKFDYFQNNEYKCNKGSYIYLFMQFNLIDL